ncbi:MAG: ParA family protein [Planctomycetes bacterium]|nr:ParA family protein [Planctomycetota bacterium]
MRIISVLNDKGGVGKTIVSSLLSDAALLLKKRVLVIDLDPQATLSRERLARYSLMREEDSVITQDDPSLADFLVDRGDPMDYVMGLAQHPLAPQKFETPEDYRLAVMWPGYHLTDTIERLSQVQLREAYEDIELWLEKARTDDRWDYCIIDNPPNRGGLSKRLALRSDIVVLPAMPEPGSFEATARTIQTIGTVPMMVVPNRYDGRIKTHKEYLEQLLGLRIPGLVTIGTTIPSSPLFLSEQAQGIPTLMYHINRPPIRATHDMIVKALGLKGKAWLQAQLRLAHTEYQPEMMAFNQRRVESVVRRAREAGQGIPPSRGN